MAKVLVIGNGGRETALAWGLAQSEAVNEIVVAPGNAGTARLPKTTNQVLSHEQTVAFAREQTVDLVVIGPEAPLVAGLSDELRAAGVAVFGASAEAAKLEASKAFATQVMQQYGIALPPSEIVHDGATALAAIEQFGGAKNAVIKADGLAGGKGVFLPDNDGEAAIAVEEILSGRVDGSGKTMVIQKRYHGPEVSAFALSDGTTCKIIPISTQDHKRLLEGDKGPNTGGVGVYAPLPDWMLSAEQWGKIGTIAQQTIDGMRAQGTPYQGVLYLGVMLAEELGGDPVIIEYNARFGDPETEVLIPLLIKNGVDIYALLSATARGELAGFNLPQAIQGSALTVCLAAKGYPAAPETGETIEGLDGQYDNVLIFHAGTKAEGEKIITSGGRVLYVVGLGDDLRQAADAAKAAIGDKGVHFKHMHYRRDIGHRALENRP